MRTRRANLWAAATASVLLLSPSLRAQDQKWYLRTDMGGTLVNNTRVNEFVVPTSFSQGFNPGFGLGIAGGYHVMPFLGVEIETGYTINGLEHLDAALMQTPFMANVVYECHHCGRFVPFLGAGVGGMASFLSFNNQTISTGNGFVTLDGSTGDMVFAYQFFGGFEYDLNDQMSLGFLYRFYGTQAPSWDVQDAFFGNTIGQISFDKTYTHCFSVVFNVKL